MIFRWEILIVRIGRRGGQGGPKEVEESSWDMEEQERKSTYRADTCWCDWISELSESFEGMFIHLKCLFFFLLFFFSILTHTH